MSLRRTDPHEQAPVCAAPAVRAPAVAAPPQTALPSLQQRLGNHRVSLLLRDGVGPPTDAAPEQLEARIKARTGQGHSLDETVRRRMEGAMGADFSDVRVHTDSEADALSHALSARAFATGPDIFFRSGEYAPGSSAGRELLAHELTHVVQSGTSVRAKLSVSEPTDDAEREADAVARAVMQAEHAGLPAARQPTPGAAAPGQVLGFWQEIKELGGGVLGIPVELPAKPFVGDVGKAPEVQKVVGSANSSYQVIYDDGKDAGPGEFWPHGPPGPMPTKSVEIERGRKGTIRILMTTWWHTQGGSYVEGTAEAMIEAHFSCDDEGAITIESPSAPTPSGGGPMVTPIAQGSVVGPRLSATAGVEHAQSSTQSGTQTQDRSSTQSNTGGREVSGSAKVEGNELVAKESGELGGKVNYSQGNERRAGEQRSTSNALQQSGMERISFTRDVALVAKPRKALASGSIERFGVNQAHVPASGINALVRWWAGLDPDLQAGVRSGAIGIRFSGHADDTGNAMHNLTLSGQRATAVQAIFEQVVGKGLVTSIEKLGNAMPEGEKKSNEHERRVDFELFRIKK